MIESVSAPNPNAIDVAEYQVGIEAELMIASGGGTGQLGIVAQALYKATGEQFARTIEEPPPDGEYSRERVIAQGLEPLGALAVSEEAALHRLAIARLAHSASSLAVACQVDLAGAFGYIFPHGSFDGTINQFDAAVVAQPEVSDLTISGPFGWSTTMQTIGEDTLATYSRVHGEFMDTAETALNMQRPPGVDKLVGATGRLLHAVSWILQKRLDSSLATAIRLEQNRI